MKDKIKNALDVYASLPSKIKSKLIRFMGLIVVPIIVLIILLIIMPFNYQIFLPFIGISGFGVSMLVAFFVKLKKHNLIQINGICTNTELNFSKTSVNKIYIKAEDKNICLIPKEKFKSIKTGNEISVYMFDNANVYYEDNYMLLNDYVAIDINGEVDTNILKFQKK